MKVHNCLDCPLAFLKDETGYIRRDCTEDMCDTMIGKPDPGAIEFYLYFHREVKNDRPIDEIVEIWKKNIKQYMEDAPLY